MCKMKNILDGINVRLDIAKQTINELQDEDVAMKTIQSKTHREKRI